MKKILWGASLLGLFLLPQTVIAAEPIKSTLDDQSKVEVTVYNNNLGLVKDIRKINLPSGEGELRFMDVASRIMPQTVHIQSLNAPDKLSILEQNYEYDLMDPNKLMDKYVGKTIKLIDRNEYQNSQKEIEATLLSNNNGPIYKIGEEIYLGHPGFKVLPKIPENLIAQPTLTWLYRNTADATQEVKVSYLTTDISWLADYIMVLDKTDATASLNGWVTVNNNSGATYKNARLKLIAGEVNRVQPSMPMSRMMAADGMGMEVKEESFAEKAFFEYHIYDLQRPTTIKDKQQKQISLLETNGIQLKKEMLAYGEKNYYMGNYSRGQKIKTPVNVYVKFKNSKENNLGMPLPAGTIRLYKEDTGSSLQFIGEDAIKHTPKDEELKLKIGEAFDVVAERKQTDYQVLGGTTYETAWEVTLRNHKEGPVTVGLVEPVSGDWQVMESSHTYTKEDAFTLRFDIDVPKDGEVKVTYRVRAKY